MTGVDGSRTWIDNACAIAQPDGIMPDTNAMPPLIDHPSPNHGPRLGGPPDMLLLHYTGMRDAAGALARLCDPKAEVSAHYMVDEAGTIFRLVAEDRRAWHAGRAFWRGERDINSRSIGIELVNPGHEWGYRPFPDAQMAALMALARDIQSRYAIDPMRVLGHSDVAPGRKQDPGELFDWKALADAGIGIWPHPHLDDFLPPGVGEIQALLDRLGYETTPAGDAHGILWDEKAEMALKAFQRHWCPTSVDKGVDNMSVAALRALIRQESARTVAFGGPDA